MAQIMTFGSGRIDASRKITKALRASDGGQMYKELVCMVNSIGQVCVALLVCFFVLFAYVRLLAMNMILGDGGYIDHQRERLNANDSHATIPGGAPRCAAGSVSSSVHGQLLQGAGSN